jgi:hypothetical protein
LDAEQGGFHRAGAGEGGGEAERRRPSVLPRHQFVIVR